MKRDNAGGSQDSFPREFLVSSSHSAIQLQGEIEASHHSGVSATFSDLSIRVDYILEAGTLQRALEKWCANRELWCMAHTIKEKGNESEAINTTISSKNIWLSSSGLDWNSPFWEYCTTPKCFNKVFLADCDRIFIFGCPFSQETAQRKMQTTEGDLKRTRSFLFGTVMFTSTPDPSVTFIYWFRRCRALSDSKYKNFWSVWPNLTGETPTGSFPHTQTKTCLQYKRP